MIKLQDFFKAIIVITIPLLFLVHGICQIMPGHSVADNIKKIVIESNNK